MNMLDFLMAASRKLPTKSEFGRLMHDDSIDEEERKRILDSVDEAGGYDNLED